ncbi:MAG TPA: S-methyl-5'-thioadenosine phosphorylase [Myxococcaceae bacterium]|nr:S-methyl-5'-thioadenosine phosphorylase [Myxococcaceae bacterium]
MGEPMLGIIGGSGLGQALGALGGTPTRVDTPFGPPSGPIHLAELDGTRVALLARHGEGHLLNPTRVPSRANIYALKSLGVTHVLASAAAGSLHEDVRPRELLIPDQVIDRTYRRPGTFFEDISVHVEFAVPFCPTLRAALLALPSEVKVHPRGTYVCMEGPQFSTRAESELHRSWGADLIGMTLMPEAKLAREAELCYAAVCLPTDYDCWRPTPDDLDKHALLREIVGNLQAATAAALTLIRRAVPAVRALGATPCTCQTALAQAVWTDRARIPDDVRSRLRLLLGRVLES